MIGQTVSHYRITAKLGEGGMGEVFLATDTNLDRQVAIKFLSADRSADPEARQRFIHEAKAQAMVSHANIAALLDAGETSGRAFLVTELVDGQPLQELARAEKLTPDDVLDLVIQIAEGLQAAHDRGVVHRDIKPENVLVTTKRQVKITDFGLARWKGATTLTKDGTRVGTAYYMSPEQAEGKRVDHRSDLFSLGVVLYELICHQRPFEGENESVVLYEILNTQPHPLARFCRDVPEELQRIVSKCLAKDPAVRYQSAADLVADMRSARGQGGTRAAMTVTRLRTMLAVLPFENLGLADDEYFADGITEEIISRLACVRSLGVISRTSVMQYKGTRKSIREIGADLGVEFVLEGTVRWNRNPQGESRVRISPQLISVAEDMHLWAGRYDRVIDDIFAVQSDIAEQVAGHLNITLAEPERLSVMAQATESLDAYQAYLRGMEYWRRPDRRRQGWELALQMFQRAVELDSKFALAYANLAIAHAGIYRWGFDATPERLVRSKEAAGRALGLQPHLPWAHMAFCYYYYWGLRDYDSALRELALAEVGLPDDPDVLMVKGAIWRRQGKFRAAIEQFERAFLLNPRDAGLPYNIAYTYSILRDYALAERFCDKSISLAPDQCRAYIRKAQTYDLWRGDTKSALATLVSCPKQDDYGIRSACASQYVLERDYAAALARLAPIQPMSGVGTAFAEAEEQMGSVFYMQAFVQYRLAVVHSLMREPDRALACYESARSILEKESEERPDDHHDHCILGLIDAGLGLRDDAIREGKMAVELLPVSKDAVIGVSMLEGLALIYVMVGEHDAALDHIEYLLSIPSDVSVALLRLNPRYDPLRSHPRFQKLLQQSDRVF